MGHPELTMARGITQRLEIPKASPEDFVSLSEATENGDVEKVKKLLKSKTWSHEELKEILDSAISLTLTDKNKVADIIFASGMNPIFTNSNNKNYEEIVNLFLNKIYNDINDQFKDSILKGDSEEVKKVFTRKQMGILYLYKFTKKSPYSCPKQRLS